MSWLKNTPLRRILGDSRPPVGGSEDLRRVVKLPRRVPPKLDGVDGDALVELMNSRLKRENHNCKCSTFKRPCIDSLKPAQAWALYEAPLVNGLLAPIGVGHGKTGLDILISMVMPDCKLAVLFIPPGLKEQLIREYLVWREHWKVPSLVIGEKGYIVPGAPVVHVVPYSRFCREGATELLEKFKPDLIIADEGHKLRDRGTVTTGRVLRYWVSYPETRLVVWSGTFTSKSIKDYAHLAALSLKEGSPLPLDPDVVDEWSMALDPSDWPAPAGELIKLGANDADHVPSDGECSYTDLCLVYGRRLVSTLGVVATMESAVGASLNLYERRPPSIPSSVKALLEDLRTGWIRPDGEELVDILSVAKSARELSCGFYYRWIFPHGEPNHLIEEWFAARKEWHKELRDKLKHREPHLDSPLLCTKAAIRFASDYSGELPVWDSYTWKRWRDVCNKVYHETEAVWVDDWLAKDSAEWAKANRGIVWYEHDAFGKRVAQLSKAPQHGGGPGAEARILAETGKRSIVCSIASHGTGRDGLQRAFNEQLVSNPPSSGGAWEQLLGRLHRVGQEADEVNTWVYRHTPEISEALDKALQSARYIESTLRSEMKLLHMASCNFSI